MHQADVITPTQHHLRLMFKWSNLFSKVELTRIKPFEYNFDQIKTKSLFSKLLLAAFLA